MYWKLKHMVYFFGNKHGTCLKQHQSHEQLNQLAENCRKSTLPPIIIKVMEVKNGSISNSSYLIIGIIYFYDYGRKEYCFFLQVNQFAGDTSDMDDWNLPSQSRCSIQQERYRFQRLRERNVSLMLAHDHRRGWGNLKSHTLQN